MGDEGKANHNAMNTLISLRDAADLEAESLDQGPSYEELSDGRKERAHQAMEAADPTLAKSTFSQNGSGMAVDARVKAATTIQSHYRGYLDRCRYLEMLYNQFEKEEEERKQKAAQQVEEGELLVENHKLEIDCEDAETTAKNKQRRYETYIITIQRAWRAYKRRQIQHPRDSPSPEQQGNNGVASPSSKRKSDILSKAHEFVELKKQFDDVLPYNAHKAAALSGSSSGSSICTSTDESSTESLSNIQDRLSSHKQQHSDTEVTLPDLNWVELERNISRSHTTASKASSNSKSVKDAHREDVRKRLAMNTPVEGLYGEVYSRPLPKPYRGQTTAMELYVNDCNEEASCGSPAGDKSDKDLAAKQQKLHDEATVAYIQAGPTAKRLIKDEKMAEEPSHIARMLGISTFRSVGESTLSQKRMESLTLPQLQVVYNAMQNEIERLSEELVGIVVARDELHMQQDSILVNIEDLERRMEELSRRHQQKKVEHKEMKKTAVNEAPAKTGSRISRLFRVGRPS